MASDALKVAITGPTGELGIAMVNALERSRRIKRIVGMARRPFDPNARGWKKTVYEQGDVTDRASVRDAVKGADVVVHLAFSIMGSGEKAREINVEGSRNVFQAAIDARAERICYASSVAAYGFHDDNPDWLDEAVPPRGTPGMLYSATKAEVEQMLAEMLMRRQRTAAYVFRPCIVAGPKAQALVESLPYVQLGERMPEAVSRLLSTMPVLRPVVPDPGARFQLVHEDDVASAFVAGVMGRGEPGPYNLAASGTLTFGDVADALGWYSVAVPELAVDVAGELVGRLPFLPEVANWIEAARKPALMKTARAKRLLKWRPKHTAKATLRQLVAAYRADERER